MRTDTVDTRADKLPGHLLKLAAVTMLGALMMQLDMTMTNIATNTLLGQFHVPLSTVQWVGTGYLLAMATVIPVAGWALERFGARTVWMSAITVFLAGSLLCAFAWSVGSLIAFRVVQGLGGGMILPLAQAILAQAAGPQRLGRVMAAIGVPSLLGPVLGPVLGGVILTDLNWRWIFLINVPICIAGLLLSRRTIPAGRSATSGRLDLAGLALLSTASAALVYGCAEAASRGSATDGHATIPTALGVVLLAAFIRHAIRVDDPLIDLRLFRARGFAAASAGMFLSTVVLFGSMALLPLYYQQVRGQDALHAGLLLIPFGVGMGLSLVVSGRLADRVAPRGIAVAGLVLAGLGTLAYTRIDLHTSFVVIGAAQLLNGAGVGAVIVPMTAAAMRMVPPAAIPRASTAVRIFQQLGGSFGSALLFVVLQRQIAGHTSGVRPDATAVAQAFGHTFWWSAAFSALALVPALLLTRDRHAAVALNRLAARG